MFNSNKAGILQDNSLFKNVDTARLKVRYSPKGVLPVREGDIVFQKGDEADFIYLVIEGEIKVKINDKFPVIKNYKKGDFFGEKEIIEKTNRISSAVAEINTLLYPFKKNQIIEYGSKDRTLLGNLTRHYQNTSKGDSEDSNVTKGQSDFIDRNFINPENGEQTEFIDFDLPQYDIDLNIPPEILEQEKEQFILEDQPTENIQQELSDEVYKEVIPEENINNQDDIFLADLDFTLNEEDKKLLDDVNIESDEITEKLDGINFDLNDEEFSKLEDEVNKQAENENKFDSQLDDNIFDSFDVDVSLNKTEPEKFNFDFPIEEPESSEEEKLFEDFQSDIIPEQEVQNEKINFSLDEYLKLNEEGIIEEPEAPEKFTLDDISDKLEEELNIKDKPQDDPAIIFEDEEEPELEELFETEDLSDLDLLDTDDNINKLFEDDDLIFDNNTSTSEQQLFEPEDENLSENGRNKSNHVDDKQLKEKLFENEDFSVDKPSEKLFEDEDIFSASLEDDLNKQEWDFLGENSKNINIDEDTNVTGEVTKDEEIHPLSYTELRDRLKDLSFMANYFLEDLSGPIEIINSSAKFLLNKDLPEEAKNAVNLIIEQASRINESIKTTIDFTESKQNSKLESKNLNDVLDSILTNLAEYTDKYNVKLYKKYDESEILNLDENKIYQAFYQIIKYSCKMAAEQGRLYFSTRKEGNTIMIEVRIPNYYLTDEQMEALFEPFGNERLGFGLALAQKIFEEHGAFLKVERKETKGTIFRILFFA
ncbi:MAG TPA: cyclic nucleotide-binding domain-containing protein [Ignavibacteriaceae bacterium]|nr:cyclic nucleotide-binding domain-containing protein [Ignavibacteriaceae bacterium]